MKIKKIKHKKLKKLFKDNNIKKEYNIDNIFKILKKINFVNFDSSIDLYINLIFKKKKNIIIKEYFKLPYSNGKKKKILLLIPKNIRNKFKKFNIDYIGGKKYINMIKEKKWTKFDIIITTKYYMPKLLKLGKILGKKGLMPNLDNNTITNNPYDKVKEIIESKKILINIINNKIINLTIGKISYNNNKLIKNLKYIIKKFIFLKKKYNNFLIKNIYLSSTMSPSFKLLFNF
ncbi:MAG: 50S ribosomal protein L1 [Candidatus Shikimatogenerans bostrichidophilus]|nr:MAG: 50S ribosomal protein L1 [Candidatus Shikimatogenerans bostrichidophilus]